MAENRESLIPGCLTVVVLLAAAAIFVWGPLWLILLVGMPVFMVVLFVIVYGLELNEILDFFRWM